MNVTLCSAFRDSAGYLDRYLAQVRGLGDALAARGDTLTCIWGEGDSIDDTRARLLREVVSGRLAGQVVDVAHGGKYHGNIVHPERFRQLAYVWGRIWERIPPEANAVLFVESDLTWDAGTLLALVDRLRDDYPIVAPLVLDGPRSFHDVWGFRMDGQHFTKEPPYLPRRTRPGLSQDGLIKLGSAGSCLAIRGPLARKLTWPKEDLVVGICAQVYRLGGSVWLDPNLEVFQ